MDIGANAGKFKIEAYAEGWPLWCRVKYDSELEIRGFTSDELYDLQYVVNRTIANIEQRAKERERRA